MSSWGPASIAEGIKTKPAPAARTPGPAQVPPGGLARSGSGPAVAHTSVSAGKRTRMLSITNTGWVRTMGAQLRPGVW